MGSIPATHPIQSIHHLIQDEIRNNGKIKARGLFRLIPEDSEQANRIK